MADSTTTKALSPQEQKDEEMINDAFQHLVDTYLASNHRRKVELITKAFNFAKKAHAGVRRRSGEPYIMHPLAVAQIACEEIGLGSTSICAALLHDVEEDTDYTNEDLSNLFGRKVANIVEGVTKISGGIFGDRVSVQAETFKKLLLMMADDIRVILIKISDRLHNMRTLSSMLSSKQYKIAAETLYIFAPIADRLGLNNIKTELENLSFKYEHPEEFAKIVKAVRDSELEREDCINDFTPDIRAKLDSLDVKYTIKARVKSPYSIWKKMQTKHIPFDEVYDILAIRIIFVPNDRSKEINECFRIYSSLTEIYKPHPTRFRDWLSNPKANGYQALHNTFMSKQGKWVEVQIRSDRMDDMAEMGFAAHWKYKDPNAVYDENELNRWLNTIKEILDDPQPDTLDLLDNIKLNLFSSEIMVFTPKGELKTLPLGATALDFAFSIHSMLGSHCFGAKVNHRLVPLNYKLKSGDQVQILTSRNQHVQAEWLNFATTAKARSKIQASLRQEARRKQQEGEEALRKFLEEHDFVFDGGMVDRLRRHFNLASAEALFSAIGVGKVSLGTPELDFLKGKKKGKKSLRRFIPFMGKGKAKDGAPTEKDTRDFVEHIDRKQTLVVDEEVLPNCQVASCCNPIPGDAVMGYISPDGKLQIHKRSCETAVKLKTRDGNNIIACKWNMHKMVPFEASIEIQGMDSKGALYAIAEVFHKLELFSVQRITLDSHDGIFEGKLRVSLFDTDDVKTICTMLQQIENVTNATRI